MLVGGEQLVAVAVVGLVPSLSLSFSRQRPFFSPFHGVISSSIQAPKPDKSLHAQNTTTAEAKAASSSKQHKHRTEAAAAAAYHSSSTHVNIQTRDDQEQQQQQPGTKLFLFHSLSLFYKGTGLTTMCRIYTQCTYVLCVLLLLLLQILTQRLRENERERERELASKQWYYFKLLLCKYIFPC